LPDIREDTKGLDAVEFLSMLRRRHVEFPDDNNSEEKEIVKGSIIVQADGEDENSSIHTETNLTVKNAELSYQNSLLRSEILRLQVLIKRFHPSTLTPMVDQSTCTESVQIVHQYTQVEHEFITMHTQTDAIEIIPYTPTVPNPPTTNLLPDKTSQLVEQLVQKWMQDEDIPMLSPPIHVPNRSRSVQDIISLLDSALKLVSNKLRSNNAESEQRVCAAARAASSGRISFRDFIEGDLALFLPTTDGTDRIYLAFHINCPNHFLAQESVDEICKQVGRYPEFILGRIIMVERFFSSQQESNSYRIPPGKMYYILTATSF
jgi:hypothetical protein